MRSKHSIILTLKYVTAINLLSFSIIGKNNIAIPTTPIDINRIENAPMSIDVFFDIMFDSGDFKRGATV